MEQFLGLPPDGSAYGYEVDHLIVIVHGLMFFLFAGWGSFFLYTIVRFRKSKNPIANYAGVKSHFSNYLEVAVAIFEVILLAGFSIPLWAKRVEAFPAEKGATIVRVVGEQFSWNVHYPGPDGLFGKTDIKLIDQDNPLGLDRTDPNAKDDITTINQLNLPVGKPVIIYLSSKDVVHSLNLPLYRVKQDAIPGMSIPVWFTPVKTSQQIREEVARYQSVAPQSLSSKLATSRVVTQDYAGKGGGVIVKQGETVTDEMIKQLQDAGISDIQVTADLSGKVAMMNYSDSSGAAILKKGDPVSDDAIQKLTAMGITKILVASETPTEIACAQLCGLGHFKMRGYMTVQTQDEFNAWIAEQEAALGNQESTPSKENKP